MRQRLEAAFRVFSEQPPTAQALIGGVVGAIGGLVASVIYDAATPVTQVPVLPLTIGAGLLSAFIVWQRALPQKEGGIEGWGSMAPTPREGSDITRTFRGKPGEASAQAAAYLASIRSEGWVETARTYTPGSWGCGAFLLALVLAFILIGILIFIYLIIVKPDGTLVVTYSKAQAIAAPAVPAGQGPADELAAWSRLRDEGIITEEEFEAKKRSLLRL